MAFIRLANNQSMTLPPDKAVAIWRVMVGEIKGTPKQRKFVRNVKRVYLNPATAPKSYLATMPKDKSIPQPIQYALPYKDQ